MSHTNKSEIKKEKNLEKNQKIAVIPNNHKIKL